MIAFILSTILYYGMEVVGEFDCIKDAAQHLNISPQFAQKLVLGQRRSSNGIEIKTK
jgi:hypothetical protein